MSLLPLLESIVDRLPHAPDGPCDDDDHTEMVSLVATMAQLLTGPQVALVVVRLSQSRGVLIQFDPNDDVFVDSTNASRVALLNAHIRHINDVTQLEEPLPQLEEIPRRLFKDTIYVAAAATAPLFVRLLSYESFTLSGPLVFPLLEAPTAAKKVKR